MTEKNYRGKCSNEQINLNCRTTIQVSKTVASFWIRIITSEFITCDYKLKIVFPYLNRSSRENNRAIDIIILLNIVVANKLLQKLLRRKIEIVADRF